MSRFRKWFPRFKIVEVAPATAAGRPEFEVHRRYWYTLGWFWSFYGSRYSIEAARALVEELVKDEQAKAEFHKRKPKVEYVE